MAQLSHVDPGPPRTPSSSDATVSMTDRGAWRCGEAVYQAKLLDGEDTQWEMLGFMKANYCMAKTLNGKLQQPSARGLSKPEQGYSPVGRARAKIESRQHEKCWEKMSVAAILTFQISTTVTDTNRVEFQGPKIVVSCLEGECGKTSNRLPTCTSFNTCCHLASVTR